MKVQWYPGHMAKARRKMIEDLKLVDLAIELLDARIPISSRNPDVDKIVGAKKRIVLLNKADMADPKVNRAWVQYFKTKGIRCILTDSVSGNGLKEVLLFAKEMMREKTERLKAKGIVTKTIRALIIGVPNVGKSSFINKLSGRSIAKTGDRPGVTKSNQWIKISSELELLDTPGILWPKFDDEIVGMNLAFTGAIKDDILDVVELAWELLSTLSERYPALLQQRYKLETMTKKISSPEEKAMLLRTIGKKRGCLIAGGEIDEQRAAVMLLDEFRGAKIGKMSLEIPEDLGDNENRGIIEKKETL